MTDLPLLGEIARLPQLGGPLSVEFLASGPASHFHLLRTTRGHGGAGASPPGAEAESHARLLSVAPVMLDLLAVLLLRWGGAAEADEAMDGAEATAWLSAFTAEVREALQAVVGPRTPETAPQDALALPERCVMQKP